MQGTRNISWGLLFVLCFLSCPVVAEDLTAPVLLGWCRDARTISLGAGGAMTTQTERSNATACVGYLRGWLDNERHLRATMPKLGLCHPMPENTQLVASFLEVAERVGWAALPLAESMTEFSNVYCPVVVPQAGTIISPTAAGKKSAPFTLAPAEQSRIQ